MREPNYQWASKMAGFWATKVAGSALASSWPPSWVSRSIVPDTTPRGSPHPVRIGAACAGIGDGAGEDCIDSEEGDCRRFRASLVGHCTSPSAGITVARATPFFGARAPPGRGKRAPKSLPIEGEPDGKADAEGGGSGAPRLRRAATPGCICSFLSFVALYGFLFLPLRIDPQSFRAMRIKRRG